MKSLSVPRTSYRDSSLPELLEVEGDTRTAELRRLLTRIHRKRATPLLKVEIFKEQHLVSADKGPSQIEYETIYEL